MNPTNPVPLLDQLGQQNLEAARARERERAEANELYWRCIDRLASGDASGGVDPATFSTLLAKLGTDLAGAKADVVAVQSIRAAETQHDDAAKNLEDATAAHTIADGAAATAKKAADDAHQAAVEAGRHEGRAQEARGAAEAKLREARAIETALRARGFPGQLRPVVVPPLRLARYIGQTTTTLYGVRLAPGDTLEVPRDAILEPPLRALKPGDPGPSRAHWLVPADAQEWPIPVRRRRFVARARFDYEVFGLHSLGETFERQVPDGEVLPSCVEELPLLPEPEKPAAVPALAEAATEPELLHENGIAAAPTVEDRLVGLLDELELDNEGEVQQ